MYKIGIIGDKDSVLGFKTMGISVFPAADAGEGENRLHWMAEENYALIYITEKLAREISSAIDLYSARRFPVVIPIPGKEGSLGMGIRGIKKSVERAVGADILFKE